MEPWKILGIALVVLFIISVIYWGLKPMYKDYDKRVQNEAKENLAAKKKQEP